MSTAPHASRRRRDRPESQIGMLAERIRAAAQYLIQDRGWTLAALEDQLDMHKNSTMRIKDLRITWTVRRKARNDGQPYREGEKTRVEEVEPTAIGDDGERAQLNWLWNPQIDTFERLERLLHLAEQHGFTGRKPARPKPWLKRGIKPEPDGQEETAVEIEISTEHVPAP